MDWAAFGLPVEGERAKTRTAGGSARRDVPTCRANETIGAVRARAERAGWDVCVVVNDAHVVFGLIESNAWKDADAEERVEKVMDKAPATFRPETRLDELTERMRKHSRRYAIVSNPDGQLIGVVSGT